MNAPYFKTSSAALFIVYRYLILNMAGLTGLEPATSYEAPGRQPGYFPFASAPKIGSGGEIRTHDLQRMKLLP